MLSTDEAESSVSEESDLEEMGKNLENMLANKKTTEQVCFFLLYSIIIISRVFYCYGKSIKKLVIEPQSEETTKFWIKPTKNLRHHVTSYRRYRLYILVIYLFT